MTRQLITASLLLQLCLQTSSAQDSVTPTGDVLPKTKKLELEEPLDVVMVRGISKFAERELHTARERRTAPWLAAKDPKAATAAARQRLRENIGAVDPITADPSPWSSVSPTGMQGAFDDSGDLVTYSNLLRWDVTEGISGEARQYTASYKSPSGQAVTQQNPPIIILLADPELDSNNTAEKNLPQRLAHMGAVVNQIVMVDRNTDYSGHSDIKQTNMTHREFVYRLGFNMGRHVIGYEVERTLAFINLIKKQEVLTDSDTPVILVGTGEGAVVAQYVAALAPNSIDAVILNGYFSSRENVWEEPIYRNVWKQLTEFGDAEIASLIAPTPLIIEAGKAPEIDGPPAPKPGQAKIAAPGVIDSPRLKDVRQEFGRAKGYYAKANNAGQLHLVESPKQVCGPETIKILNESLGLKLKMPTEAAMNALKVPEINPEVLQGQQKRLIDELVRHTQMLLARSDKVRAKLWKDVDRSSVEAWEKQAPKYREMVYNSFIGKLDPATVGPNPRTRKVIDEETHVGYEVVLDLHPTEKWSEDDPGVFAGGILLLPKDLKKGEQRPVVVCQHGLEGIPMDTITLDEANRAFRAYKGFSTQLVKRGFIVYAPQNPYRGYDDFRVLQRKSNPLGRSLFSYIIPQHRQTLKWLASLDYVDSARIAFYGLSYGGKTAVRVPPFLANDFGFSAELDIPFRSDSFKIDGPSKKGEPVELAPPAYCLSICSADFNEWIRKNVSAEDRYSYIYTGEYEIFEWNMGHVANYAELSWLMAPRPFMVERGHDDGVAPDEWVGWEFAKVRRHYDKLGIGEDTEIEWFNGPHTINGQGTFRFLHKHLNWPEPK